MAVDPAPRPWGWNGAVRGMLIGVAALLGSMLAWASRGGPVVPMPVPSLVLDANTAPGEVLGALPGIGPVLAARIVEAREASLFRSLDDLDRRVKGIGPAKVAALKPFLRFGSAEPTTTLPPESGSRRPGRRPIRLFNHNRPDINNF